MASRTHSSLGLELVASRANVYLAQVCCDKHEQFMDTQTEELFVAILLIMTTSDELFKYNSDKTKNDNYPNINTDSNKTKYSTLFPAHDAHWRSLKICTGNNAERIRAGAPGAQDRAPAHARASQRRQLQLWRCVDTTCSTHNRANAVITTDDNGVRDTKCARTSYLCCSTRAMQSTSVAAVVVGCEYAVNLDCAHDTGCANKRSTCSTSAHSDDSAGCTDADTGAPCRFAAPTRT